MNQIIQWMLISGIVGAAFATVSYYAIDELDLQFLSLKDKIDAQKKKASENIKLIDVVHAPSLQVDVMNVGLDTISIKKLFVDGTVDDSYVLSDRYGNTVNDMPTNEIVTITPSFPGSKIIIITASNKQFSFE